MANATHIGLEQVRQQLRQPRSQLKGRQASDEARAQVRALIGTPPSDGHRRDLLIEHLHVLNDHFHGLFERHIVALAAKLQLRLSHTRTVMRGAVASSFRISKWW